MNRKLNLWGHALVASVVILCLVLASGCGPRTTRGAGIGAAVGAVTGAVVGHQTGHRTEGAVIGAATGAAVGGLIGARLDKQAEELAKIAETKRTEQGLIVTLSSNRIHFDVNSSSVKDDSRAILADLAGVLKNYPEDVIVVAGHTDSDGTSDYNMSLSEMRAQSVADVLMSNGVPRGSIEAHGYGETQPVASNDTPDGKAQNRRVELSITVDESKVPKE